MLYLVKQENPVYGDNIEISKYTCYNIELSDKIFDRLYGKDSCLMSTVSLTNMVAVCLCKIYRNGFAVDYVGLEEVKQEFEQLQADYKTNKIDDSVYAEEKAKLDERLKELNAVASNRIAFKVEFTNRYFHRRYLDKFD